MKTIEVQDGSHNVHRLVKVKRSKAHWILGHLASRTTVDRNQYGLGYIPEHLFHHVLLFFKGIVRVRRMKYGIVRWKLVVYVNYR